MKCFVGESFHFRKLLMWLSFSQKKKKHLKIVGGNLLFLKKLYIFIVYITMF